MSEKTPSVKPAEAKIRYFWFADIFVVVFFLSAAVFSLYLFRADLMQTLEARDEEPAGTIVIRHNVVQRRYADRVLWDRLFVDSPVYSGDLIRAADISEATIYIADNQIDLNENTLIRIQYSPDGRGPFEIELREGNLSLSSGTESSGIMLNLMGRQVQTGPGTVLNAAVGEEGIKIQVSEGSATFIEGNNIRLLAEGTMVAQDADGRELAIPAVVVKSPQPNARYLKNRLGPLLVNFDWNRINLGYGENLRLELAGDPNFIRNFRAIEGLDSQAQMDFDAGIWYWRLAYKDAILSAGQLTVADASGPDLQSPVINSVFRYQNELPQLRFQWSEKLEASYYLLEVSETSDFVNPQISKQIAAASYIQSELGQGTWYWRVLPVFSSAYEGSAIYSSPASFRIELSSDTQAPSIEVPEPVLMYYTVKSGDTLARIAAQVYGVASWWPIIVAANSIANPNLIYPEQVLFIPPEE
jgi:LysM repeat protein